MSTARKVKTVPRQADFRRLKLRLQNARLAMLDLAFLARIQGRPGEWDSLTALADRTAILCEDLEGITKDSLGLKRPSFKPPQADHMGVGPPPQ